MGAKGQYVTEAVEKFIERWEKSGGSERANYQLFLTELCALLELPMPDPAGDDTRDNGYVFERRVVMHQSDGSSGSGFIDLYRRGAFVCEAKQTGKVLDSTGWDRAMLRAQNQADQYARALPAGEGRPPFIVVTDVGRSIELYAEFSRSGATYTPFPDARTHRIKLQDLRHEAVRERIRAVWLDPLSLDPTRKSARVTRDIADRLAKLAKSLEGQGHAPETVAGFLMRAMFTMFAEDVGLIPLRSFTELLESLRDNVKTFVPMVEGLWRDMDKGGFSVALRTDVLRFNGGLFALQGALAIDRDQLELLIDAAHADWRYVEPAIFGTLLERALDPRERHKLGAHYTPRAYVERLILPTVMEPLRAEWREVQAAALAFEQQGKRKDAQAEVQAFHRHLATVRVLDPACGSGNFLYVTLEHMKRLEGEVLNLLHDLGLSQAGLNLEGESFAVTPDQFLGIELNPRAARIAEMVLWIGYLQWHFRTHGTTNPPEPVLHDYHNIENRDALLDYDAEELVRDESGKPVTRWDGVSFKPSPVTGEAIPDESKQVVHHRHVNPRKAAWPAADYIVGNPPFVGGWKVRDALGDGYVEALWGVFPHIPQKADLVMYWWDIAADQVRHGSAQRFGFITTNSIRQVFQRRVVERHLEDSTAPLSIAFAIPDHPWVDATDGAAVRIAMTVCVGGETEGVRHDVRAETESGDIELEVLLSATVGKIHPDLRVGAAVTTATALHANKGISSPGVQLYGKGFVLEEAEARAMVDASPTSQTRVMRPYANARDVMQKHRGHYVIDFFGMSETEARRAHPAAFQHVLENVKPVRAVNRRPAIRDVWWRFGWERPMLRAMLAGVGRFISTPETCKHRVFVSWDHETLPDNMLTVIAVEDWHLHGVLSSRLHIAWALATGGRLGVGNDPRYNKTRCFEPFPFPHASVDQQARIGDLAEEIDALRKRQQAAYSDLTLTGIYNVLEKLRTGQELSDKERVIHEQGIVSVLRDLHDQLDAAVFDAYGWGDLGQILVGRPGATTPLPDKPDDQAEAEEELLRRLVALNAERAAEEAQGHVRWLRPEFQAPDEARSQGEFEGLEPTEESEVAPAAKKATKSSWPKAMRDQVAAVRSALERGAATPEAIAGQFKRNPEVAVRSVLEALQELGMVREEGAVYRLAS
ncbi:MAG: class I SAM-dependent DNA methyltransferase [Sandaracinaceae bacterium]|nr:class I SAM-dependent DNA methyltransferase [Sandaracinaceae bacterium]